MTTRRGIRFSMPASVPAAGVLITSWLAVALPATARDTPGDAPSADAPADAPASLADAPRLEQQTLDELLASPHWPLRACGLLRLERYRNQDVQPLIDAALDDNAWQVRAFAVRAAQRHDVTIDPARFADETQPQVLRGLLRAGISLPEDQLRPIVAKLLRTPVLDDRLLGIELAAASGLPDLRHKATIEVRRLIRAMNTVVARLASDRLAALLNIVPPPQTPDAWREWLADHDRRIDFVDPAHFRTPLPPRSEVANLSSEAFAMLLDYLGALQERDLDLMIALDCTHSMLPVIDEARVGVDRLILFLSDISRSARVALVGYRDHDNPPVWEGEPFTEDVLAVRRFLYDLRITGGRDYPEAVLEGVAAASQLTWREDAVRQIVIVGDAPPHEKDMYQLRELLASYRTAGIAVHAVHVPMPLESVIPEVVPGNTAADARTWLDEYNHDTAMAFREIADLGAGRFAPLPDSADLVPAIMRFTIDQHWWPVFEDFYTRYLTLCR